MSDDESLLVGAARRVPARAFDFNGDGYVDLAVGVPGEDVGRAKDGGAVQVIYGSRTGLRAWGDQFWTQNSRGVPGVARRGERFGSSLASGDFNGDGYADLVVFADGNHVEGNGGHVEGGRAAQDSVYILKGARSGLTSRGIQWWPFSALGMDCLHDPCGLRSGLVGDFTGDGIADLAIDYCNDPYESERAGLVLRGGTSGLSTKGVLDTRWPVQVGDASGDGIDDLLVLTPGDSDTFDLQLGSRTNPLTRSVPADQGGALADVDGDGRSEMVAIDYHEDGVWIEVRELSRVGDEFEFGSPVAVRVGIPSGMWRGQLTTGDVTGDGVADLLQELHGSDSPYGVVALIRGTRGTGILAQEAQVLSQSTTGVRGRDEEGDEFGSVLAIGRFRGGRHADVAIGAPGEDRGRGLVTVLRGTRSGLTVRGQQQWSQDSPGIKGRAESGDRFGAAM